jgi:hypothetical protein
MKRKLVGMAGGLCLLLGCIEGGWAGEEKSKDQGMADQIGASVKNLATKIEKEVTGVVKKLEESETPKKVGAELKRSADSLGEKVEQAGKKVKESLKSE